MLIKDVSKLDADEVKVLIARIPYFNELKLTDYEQYNLLLEHSKVISLDPGEVLLRKGESGKEIYFLASGYLDVFSDVEPGDKALNQLTTGEIIAALSIINDQPRTATLAASTSFAGSRTRLIATDFSIFGSLHDFTNIKLQTKINLLRLVINNIRFKLSTYQKRYPEHRLTSNSHDIGFYAGEPNTIEELDSLAGQAFVMTSLLHKWNNETESSIEVPEVKVSPKDKILRFFNKKS